jgi:nicotinamide-nucleotide amidase
VYSRNGQSLEATIGWLLSEQNGHLSTAESCTGGLLAQRVTAVSGSSKYFVGGFVTYSDELKTRLLGVHPDLIRVHGAVSEPVARAMAIGSRNVMRSTYGLSVTGFAGPLGGTEDNPIGTVYVGLANGKECEVKRFQWAGGDRDRIRVLAAQAALDMLRRKLVTT